MGGEAVLKRAIAGVSDVHCALVLLPVPGRSWTSPLLQVQLQLQLQRDYSEFPNSEITITRFIAPTKKQRLDRSLKRQENSL
ncbi:Uncharacterized protein ALO94_03857 [Pseudomonas syringae pv. spinaceae]|uniref:Uncharacterized protein n=1 Tax=Pseudomonas syringae pv. spinaceae TaxID=264459 RepID=A0A0N8SUL5_PSESX|nr:Uncharacterized protein ALO94_03857 [Pseudomonas syringae pv. spinaceae]